jgi:hypothetical protein
MVRDELLLCWLGLGLGLGPGLKFHVSISKLGFV